MTKSGVFYNPANSSNFAGTLPAIFKELLLKTNNMLPAKVIAYERSKNRAQVQPQIKAVFVNEDDPSKTVEESRPILQSVPVLTLGGGDFLLSFNIKAGDLGWLFAADADISLFMQNYEESKPNTLDIKSFSSAIFIPDIINVGKFTIDPEDAGNVVLQNSDGTVKISLGNNSIKIKAPTINIDGGNVNITGGTVATFGTTKLNNGSKPVARLGDLVAPDPLTGNLVIQQGSSSVFSE